jgi:hypothetical protein
MCSLPGSDPAYATEECLKDDSSVPASALVPLQKARALPTWVAEPATAAYIGLIAVIAHVTGLFYILFPELGALSHDILKRPQGAWARAPLMLVATPALTAIAGTMITRHLPYGMPSALLSIGTSVLVIGVLRSPIAPAISAGLLPLTLGIKSWWYPPSLLIGTGLLAGIALVWSRIRSAAEPEGRDAALIDDIVEEAPSSYSWVPFFLAFLVPAIAVSSLPGWRFLLFPPLVVIGFEMFAHADVCPWARRPIALPVACGSSAAAGVLCIGLFGAGPIGAMASILAGVAILRALDLHVPPALAVALLPFVMPHPSYQFPLVVTLGTALQSASFLAWRRIKGRHAMIGPVNPGRQ